MSGSVGQINTPTGPRLAEEVVSTIRGSSFTQTIVTLDAAHIAGTKAIVPANLARRGITFGGASGSLLLSLEASQPNGMKFAAAFRDGVYGGECPVGAFYLATTGQGVTAGATIVVWEA